MMIEDLKKKIRDIPDFPNEGIIFKDITTLLNDAEAFVEIIDAMKNRYQDKAIDTIVGIEARGFILGAALAYAMRKKFVPIRKPGKLPYKTYSASYELEYGTDSIEIHQDAVSQGQRVIIIDDLLATGGTVNAATALMKKLGAEVVELAFMIELTFLHGREKVEGYEVFSLIEF